MRLRHCALVLAAAASLGLGACNRSDTHPSARANAPGSPGTGNSTEVATPAGVDSNAGGSSGEKGTMRTPGSSGGGAVTGATGTGTAGASSMGGPGVGLSGGLAPSGSASQPTGVAEGGGNRTPRSSVGNR